MVETTRSHDGAEMVESHSTSEESSLGKIIREKVLQNLWVTYQEPSSHGLYRVFLVNPNPSLLVQPCYSAPQTNSRSFRSYTIYI